MLIDQLIPIYIYDHMKDEFDNPLVLCDRDDVIIGARFRWHVRYLYVTIRD